MALTTAGAFGEDQGRYIVATAQGVDIPGAVKIGTTGGDAVAGVTLADLRGAHEGFFPTLMDAEL